MEGSEGFYCSAELLLKHPPTTRTLIMEPCNRVHAHMHVYKVESDATLKKAVSNVS